MIKTKKSSKIILIVIAIVLFVSAYREWQADNLGYALGLAIIGILMIGVQANVKSCRRWLENNEIFFKTVAFVFLTIMAIVVSSYQIQLMKQEKYPRLNFCVELSSDYPIDDTLIISNIGPSLSEFECQKVVFLEIEYGKIGERIETVMIPLIEYYDWTTPPSFQTRELATLSKPGFPEGNYSKVNMTILKFQEFAEKRDATGYGKILRYVQVWYKDIWAEKHVKFFFVDEFGFSEVKNERGKELFEEHENKIRELLYLKLEELSADSLYEMWTKCIVADNGKIGDGLKVNYNFVVLIILFISATALFLSEYRTKIIERFYRKK